jgi:hypothetical protein
LLGLLPLLRLAQTSTIEKAINQQPPMGPRYRYFTSDGGPPNGGAPPGAPPKPPWIRSIRVSSSPRRPSIFLFRARRATAIYIPSIQPPRSRVFYDLPSHISSSTGFRNLPSNVSSSTASHLHWEPAFISSGQRCVHWQSASATAGTYMDRCHCTESTSLQ